MERDAEASAERFQRRPCKETSLSETRIASVSGLRGIVGNGIDPATAAEFAAAYASLCPPGPILVGNDGRISAPIFQRAAAAAIAAAGHDVLELGAVATPTLGFLVKRTGAAGGVQISASHNPPEYNGIKFFQPAGMVLSPDAGREVIERWRSRSFGWASYLHLGRIRPFGDADSAHLQAVLDIVDVPAIRARGFRVVLDACHGAGGRLGRLVLEALGCKTIVLGEMPDGRYDHPPEPTQANLSEVAAIISAVGADVGFAQDPDADRLALIDETGRYLSEELTLAIAVEHRLAQQPGPVAMNLSTSRVAEAVAERLGCPTIRTPVGEIHVVEAMRSANAVLGGEGNGGVIDPRVGFVRDSFVGMALTLDALAADPLRRPLSQRANALPRFAMVKRKFDRDPEADLGAIWNRVTQAYPEAAADRRDGLRLDWPDGWVHLRASNTEPIVRVIAEAKEENRARALADQLEPWLRPEPRS